MADKGRYEEEKELDSERFEIKLLGPMSYVRIEHKAKASKILHWSKVEENHSSDEWLAN